MKFTSAETAAIENARKQYPEMSQRALAKIVTDRYEEPIGIPLRLRTESSIYSALRRYDNALTGGAVTLGETLPV